MRRKQKEEKVQIKEKRALSDVITTVLIVLLSLAAVVLVWMFVRNTIAPEDTGLGTLGEYIELSQIRFKITNVLYDNNNSLGFFLQRESGGSGVLPGVFITLVSTSGKTSRIDSYNTTTFEEIQSRKIAITSAEHSIQSPDKIRRIEVYAARKLKTGKITPYENPAATYDISIQAPAQCTSAAACTAATECQSAACPSGTCEYPAANSGASCNNHLGTCQDGVCTPIPTSCTTNAQCLAANPAQPKCNPANICVECLLNGDCTLPKTCQAGVCTAPPQPIQLTACDTTGPQINQSNTNYILLTDVSISNGTCFKIVADNISLDGSFKSIYGDGQSEPVDYESGVSSDEQTNISIKDLSIKDIEIAINFSSIMNSLIGNVIISNTGVPIALHECQSNRIIDSDLINVSIVGINIYGGSDNNLIQNISCTRDEIQHWSICAAIAYSKDNTFNNNRFCGNSSGYSFYCVSSTGEKGSGNTYNSQLNCGDPPGFGSSMGSC